MQPPVKIITKSFGIPDMNRLDVALANGARNVIPFDSTEEVILRSKSFARGDVRLAGERKMHAIPGFDFGNSPAEFTAETT